MSTPVYIKGFTNDTLGWQAWLDVIQLAQATPAQMAVLEESHPKAKESDYYLFLVHQPEICGNVPWRSMPSCMHLAVCRAQSESLPQRLFQESMVAFTVRQFMHSVSSNWPNDWTQAAPSR